MHNSDHHESAHIPLARYYARLAWPALPVCVIVIGLLFFVYFWRPVQVQRDMEGAVTQQAEGTVTCVSLMPSNRRNPNPPLAVQLVINGKEVTTYTHVPVKSGQSFLVTYRVGKSGTIYLDRLAPLPQK